jgi:hypothetical protein
MPGLTVQSIAPMQNYTLGGAQFFGHDRRLYTVRADPSSHNEAPVEIHVGARDQRFMLDMPIEDAEALIACLTNAIRLRREAEAIAKATATRQARAHFMDSDGVLEAA